MLIHEQFNFFNTTVVLSIYRITDQQAHDKASAAATNAVLGQNILHPCCLSCHLGLAMQFSWAPSCDSCLSLRWNRPFAHWTNRSHEDCRHQHSLHCPHDAWKNSPGEFHFVHSLYAQFLAFQMSGFHSMNAICIASG